MAMLKLKFSSHPIFWLAAIVLLIVLAACSPDTAVVEPPTIEPVVEATVPSATDTPSTPPTPEAVPSALLITGVEVDPFLMLQTQNVLETLTDEASMSLVLLDELTSEALTPGVQVVVGLGQGLGLNAFAANTPGVSFVAIRDPEAVVADNLSVIGEPSLEVWQQAFMAGYVSALISSDNKVTALIAEENAARDMLAESYVAGVRFFCGICQPIYPPYNPFPQWETLPSPLSDNEFRPIVNNFVNMGVEIVYVQGDLIAPELLAFLEELDIKVISDRSPDIPRSNWVGTITTDPSPALEALWPDLLMATPGQQVPAAIVLTDTDLGLISEGRYRLVENMIADLQAGLVSIELTPQTD